MLDQFNINRCDDCGTKCDRDFCSDCESTAEYYPPLSLIEQSKRDAEVDGAA